MKLTAAAIILVVALFCLPLTIRAEEIIINAVGDIMPAGRWASSISKSGYDSPFRGVAAERRTGNISVANLESALARRGNEFADKKFRFRAEPEVTGIIEHLNSLSDHLNTQIQGRDGRHVISF